jgi:hypothetical protein
MADVEVNPAQLYLGHEVGSGGSPSNKLSTSFF